jgi:beta-glucanase (GH16 family)
MLRRNRIQEPSGRLMLLLVFVLVSVLLVGCGSTSPPRNQTRTTGSRGGAHGPMDVAGHWKLVLNLTFSDSSLNTAIWRPGWFGDGISGPINKHELACYNPQNITFAAGGTVNLNVTHAPSTCQGVSHPYTGAVLSTNPSDGRPTGGFEYTYGVLEAEIYVPSAHGQIANWPTVMTLGQHWPQDGEDDIMEGLDGTVCFHWHSPGYAPGGNLGACDPAFSPGWHTVEADWQPGSVTWYYDGTQVGRATKGVTSAPMYIVLANTVSVKAPQVAEPGAALKIKYIRVWQPAGAQAARAGYEHSF